MRPRMRRLLRHRALAAIRSNSPLRPWQARFYRTIGLRRLRNSCLLSSNPKLSGAIRGSMHFLK